MGRLWIVLWVLWALAVAWVGALGRIAYSPDVYHNSTYDKSVSVEQLLDEGAITPGQAEWIRKARPERILGGAYIHRSGFYFTQPVTQNRWLWMLALVLAPALFLVGKRVFRMRGKVGRVSRDAVRRAVLASGLLAIAAMGVFPPWVTAPERHPSATTPAGYHFLLNGPEPPPRPSRWVEAYDNSLYGKSTSEGPRFVRIDYARLAVQWFIVAVLLGVAVVLTGVRPSGRPDS